MSSDVAIAQLNVRMPRDLKQRGDATLAMSGSSPAKVIRRLWEKLAQGGSSWERVASALFDDGSDVTTADQDHELRLQRSASLFEELGTALGLDAQSFHPDVRPESEILEELEWNRLVEQGLA